MEIFQHKFDQCKITVSIDSFNPVVSDRLKNMMSRSGVKVQELTLPSGKIHVLGWMWRLKRSESKVAHYLWGAHDPLTYAISKLLGKKVIIHWVGTDVLSVTSRKEQAGNTLLRKIAYRMVDLHLAVSEALASELKPLGIDATVVPLVPDMPLLQEEITWPSEDVVLVYLPEARPGFYGSSIVFRLAQELPHVRFLIIAHAGEDVPQLPNIEYLGWTNLEAVWRRVKIYLRLTQHDGLSNMVIEALGRGKRVIWSYPYPYCHQARTFEEAKGAIKDILRQNHPNIEGMHYVQGEFKLSKMAQNYRDIYLKLLS